MIVFKKYFFIVKNIRKIILDLMQLLTYLYQKEMEYSDEKGKKN